MPKIREPDERKAPDEPSTRFSPKELATVLAALRRWQEVLGEDEPFTEMVHFSEHDPLTADEIDGLCERLNVASAVAQVSAAHESPVLSNTARDFNVHCYAVLRCLVKGIQADSPKAAVETACERVMPDLRQRFTTDEGEFADEFSHFLVDVVGDENYDESVWFHISEQPLLSYLEKLVRWADEHAAGIHPELAQLVDDVRGELLAVA